jgi:prophage regulatory protein
MARSRLERRIVESIKRREGAPESDDLNARIRERPSRQPAERHLRRPVVEEITGLSRSTIYDLMARGQFPRPVKLTTKAVAWPESAIQAWLDERAAQSSASR